MLLRSFNYSELGSDIIIDTDVCEDDDLRLIRTALRDVVKGKRVRVRAPASKADIYMIDSNARLVLDNQVSIILEDEREVFQLLSLFAASAPLMIIMMYVSLLASKRTIKFDGQGLRFNHIIGLDGSVVFCDATEVALHKWVISDEEEAGDRDWFDLFDLNFDDHRKALTDWMIFNYLYVLLPSEDKLRGPTRLLEGDFRVHFSDHLEIAYSNGRTRLLQKRECLWLFQDCENLILAIIDANFKIRSSCEVADFYKQPEWFVYKMIKDLQFY